MSTIRLTDREQQELLRAQRALLSPAAESVAGDDWQLRANRAVREYLGADHSVFAVPRPDRELPPMLTEDTDPTMPDRLYELVEGWRDPYYSTTDPYLEFAIRQRLDGGPDAYHLDELLSPEQQAESTSIQEVFVPAGMRAMVGLSMPVEDGEATQFFGFEDRTATGLTERGLWKLSLLVPAFAAGVRTFRSRLNRLEQFGRTLDRLDHPLALYAADGGLLHRNRALQALLLDDADSERIAGVIDRLADAARARQRGPRRAQEPLPTTVETRLRTGSGSYRIAATYGARESGGTRRILVQVERLGPRLPGAEDLVESHGLTPREAEVARLLARGHTDRAVARALGVSWHTARTHTRNLFTKLGISSRAEVALALLRPANEDDG